MVTRFVELIPEEIPSELKQSPQDFTRKRFLPLGKTIALTLSMTANGADSGVDTKCGQFFKNARRSGLWPDAEAVHRSGVTKARKKIDWRIFQKILEDAVDLAYDLWPEDDDQYLWHGMSVFATDGSKFNLPAAEEIRDYFDPDSGLENDGKGHYPQCLVSTVYDVLRRLPVARTVVENNGSEREELKKLRPFVPSGGIWTFDRGYPSYETLLFLIENYSGYWLFRCPATGTFSAVKKFVNSGKKEDVIFITPSNKFKSKVGINERKKLKPLKVRIVRLESPDGTVSVLLTNLFGKNRFRQSDIQSLYFKRWRIEEYYRDEKVVMGIEKFHSRSVNGILQELYAAMIMSVITRCLMLITTQYILLPHQEAQFKNAVTSLASDTAFLVQNNPKQAISVFQELLEEIARVKYYRPAKPRAPQPRVNKSPLNKWQKNKKSKCAAKA